MTNVTPTISLFDGINFSAFLAHISDDTVPIFPYVLFPVSLINGKTI
jgi:hypothetical protein